MRFLIPLVSAITIGAVFLPSTYASTPLRIDWIEQYTGVGGDAKLTVVPRGLEIAADDSSVFAMETYSYDTFLRTSTISKRSPEGELLWTTVIDPLRDISISDISVDQTGNTFFTGLYSADEEGYIRNVIAGKLDPSGNIIWHHSLGSEESESVGAIVADTSGGVYIAGETEGGLGGVNKGESDAFLAKLNQDGHFQWIRQFGTTGSDNSSDHYNYD